MKYVPLISLDTLAQTQSPYKTTTIKKQIKEKQLYAQLPLDPAFIKNIKIEDDKEKNKYPSSYIIYKDKYILGKNILEVFNEKSSECKSPLNFAVEKNINNILLTHLAN